MATLIEYYNINDDAADGIPATGGTYNYQTFTPQVAFSFTDIKVKLYRIGTSSYFVQVGLWSLDGVGNPSVELVGAVGFSQIAFSSLTTDSGGEWYTFTLVTPYSLAADTEYAIMMSQGGTTNKFYWKYDSADSTYTRGDRLIEVLGVYTRYTGTDYMFELYAGTGVTTLAATNITNTNATLHGLASSQGYSILCGFEYGYTTSYGTTKYFNSGYTPFITYYSVGIDGLIPETVYHFRAFAYDGANYYYGADAEFTTTGSAYPAGSKLLKGSLTYDGGGDCSMRFQWGLTTTYGNDTQWTTGKLTGAIHSLPLTPSQLVSGQTYHYRVQARNINSTANGADIDFTVS